MAIDLDKLEQKFRQFFDKETEESFNEWLASKIKVEPSPEQDEFDKLQKAFQEQAKIKDEQYLEIERLKGLIEKAFGVDETQRTFKQFKIENNI